MNIAELRSLMERATPGPWKAVPGGEIPMSSIHDAHRRAVADVDLGSVDCCAHGRLADGTYQFNHDAALIAAAVNALPHLLAVVEAAHRIAHPEGSTTAEWPALWNDLKAALAAWEGQK